MCSKLCIMPAHSCSAASVYSDYEVDDDWCVSVLQSYQAEGDVLFPWSVGKPGPFIIYKSNKQLTVLPSYMYHLTVLFFFNMVSLLMSPGEDMTLEGRRQLALFLVRK